MTRVQVRWCVTVLIGAFSVSFPTRAAAQAVRYDSSAAAVVASLHEHVGEIEHPDPGPSLQLFGDGRIAAHFPPYMRRAGDWSARLSAAEMRHLVHSLAATGLLDVDPDATRSAVRRARAARRAAALRRETTLFEASDPSLTTMTLRANGRERTVAWRGLRADAHAHPDVVEVQQLRAAHDTLRGLMNRPGLARVR
jgi:hypothetical protein